MMTEKEMQNKCIKLEKKLYELAKAEKYNFDAISAFATQAIELKTGARGLRTIIENAMLPVMYSAPRNKNIQKIVMDVDEKDSLKVVPTVIENPKTTEEVSA